MKVEKSNETRMANSLVNCSFHSEVFFVSKVSGYEDHGSNICRPIIHGSELMNHSRETCSPHSGTHYDRKASGTYLINIVIEGMSNQFRIQKLRTVSFAHQLLRHSSHDLELITSSKRNSPSQITPSASCLP